jgi:hypothetical protein
VTCDLVEGIRSTETGLIEFDEEGGQRAGGHSPTGRCTGVLLSSRPVSLGGRLHIEVFRREFDAWIQVASA